MVDGRTSTFHAPRITHHVSTSSNSPGRDPDPLPKPRHHKVFLANIPFSQRLAQVPRRVVNRLVGEVESPEMHADTLAGPHIEVDAHCFIGIHVRLAHEPPRLV